MLLEEADSFSGTEMLEEGSIYYAIYVHSGAVTIPQKSLDFLPKSHRNKILKMLRSYGEYEVDTSPK